jgi:hypothetical protein
MSLADYKAKYEVKELLGTGPALTVPEKYFILAAFHDALCEAERMSPIIPEEWQGDSMRQVEHRGQQTEWFRTPDFAACFMYLYHSGQCADLPDEQLQPAMLERFLEDVKADLGPVVSGKQGHSSRRLFWSILRRSTLWLVVLSGLECAVVLCAWRWGEGENPWQRITNSWVWLGPVFMGSAIAYPFFLGRQRWRVIQFWRGNDK